MNLFLVVSSACTQLRVLSAPEPVLNEPVTSAWPSRSCIEYDAPARLGIASERRAIDLTAPPDNVQDSFLSITNVILSMLVKIATPTSAFPSSGASVVSSVLTCLGGALKSPW